MNHYQLLGIAKDATAGEIRKAFRAKAARLHPDRFASAGESVEETRHRDAQFTALQRAYRTLSDRQARYEYDRSIQIPQGLGDLLATPQGMRAMGRLLPRAPKQARDGDDLVTVVRVPSSVLATGGAVSTPDAVPCEFDPFLIPADARKTPWGRLSEHGEKGENDGTDGDLFILVVPETP